MSVVALTGGVGGAKLALGLQCVVPPAELALVVNTGDDFVHLGLHISPDIDTLIYTLAGVVNTQTGWGLADETWSFMRELERLGGETWFRLGDADLATHVERTRRLAAGESLTSVTTDLARHLGVAAQILPASDDPIRTRLATAEGNLAFQEYFVARRCAPRVTSISYSGAAEARPTESILRALQDEHLEAVVICPSNPWLSIAPILAVPGLRDALQQCGAPVVAISPLVGGTAVKGPTTRIMAELGLPVSAIAVTDFYQDLLDGFVLDARDNHLATEIDLPVCCVDTLMVSLADRQRVAGAALQFATRLGGGIDRP